MNDRKTIKKITRILKAKPFRITAGIRPESRIKDFKDWDSLKHLTFLIAVENEFDVEIAPEEVNKINTLAELIGKIGENDNS